MVHNYCLLFIAELMNEYVLFCFGNSESNLLFFFLFLFCSFSISMLLSKEKKKTSDPDVRNAANVCTQNVCWN